MDFLELAKKRFSVRKYMDKKVEEEKLLKILEAGRVAPTCANTQPQKLIIVKDEEGFSKLNKGAETYGAPLAIIVCADQSISWKRPSDGKDIAEIDASIVTDHMMLQATELGLGTCWICYFDEETIREQFNIAEHVDPVNILAIGYTDADTASPGRHTKSRKPLSQLILTEE